MPFDRRAPVRAEESPHREAGVRHEPHDIEIESVLLAGKKFELDSVIVRIDDRPVISAAVVLDQEHLVAVLKGRVIQLPSRNAVRHDPVDFLIRSLYPLVLFVPVTQLPSSRVFISFVGVDCYQLDIVSVLCQVLIGLVIIYIEGKERAVHPEKNQTGLFC